MIADRRASETRTRAVLCSTLALVFATTAVAQDRTALVLQREARRQFELLRERLQRLSAIDGQDQAVLESGNRFLQDHGLSVRMIEIESLIEAERYDEALRQMRELRSELTGLLDLLLGRDQEVADLGAEIERLENYRARVRDLRDAQREETERAERSAALASLDKQIALALEALRSIQQSESDVAERLRNSPEVDPITQAQSAIVTAARDLEPRIRRIQSAARSLSLLGEDDEFLLARSSEITTAADRALLQIATDRPQSIASIDDAVDACSDLESRLLGLAERVQQEAAKDPLSDQRSDQESTSESTRELADEMRADDQAGNRHTPGREDLEQAIPEQESALDELGRNRAQSASQEQREALENLENAERQLDEALKQLEEQKQEEILQNLEAEFTEMLNAQRDLTRRTRSAFELAQGFEGELPAALSQRAQDLSASESALESRAREALDVLVEDGSSTALPQLVELIRSDLHEIAVRLAASPTVTASFGPSIESRQVEVEATLEDLVSALRQEIEDGESGEPSESEGEPELLPRTAELKLVLIQQRRINENTRVLDASGPSAGTEETSRLAERQDRVATLLREIATRLDAEQREREERIRNGGGR